MNDEIKKNQFFKPFTIKGVSEEAKKKFTFKTILLYIEDNHLFDSNYGHSERLDSIKKVQDSIKYSNFKSYYSLLENVRFFKVNFMEI